MVEYDEKAAREIERSYTAPEIVLQRSCTLEALALHSGEYVLDAGCGTGFLTQELAMAVGSNGWVVGVDNSPAMLELATQRCQGLPQVHLKQGSVEELLEKKETFDAVTCTQVLLYLSEVSQGISEMHRVLKRGGRIAVLETDWRGVVLSSSDEALSRRMFSAWDCAVPNPNLPVQLGSLLRAQGFTDIRVDAIPILNTSYAPDNFSGAMFEWAAHYAQEQGVVTEEEAAMWLSDLAKLGEKGEFFFCVNRFLFNAIKL